MISNAHELKVLVSSFHSLIVIESSEEERIRTLLGQVSQQLQIEMTDWSSSRGLRGAITLETHEHANSAEACLDQLVTMPGTVIVWLKDFARELENKIVLRKLRELVKKFNQSRSTIIISGPSVTLPEELKHLAIRFDLSFPSRDEYRKTVMGVIDSLQRSGRAEMKMSPAEFEKYLDLLRGLTLNQARQITAQAIISDGEFDAQDFSLIEQKKIQAIKEDGILEYFPVQQNEFELGGLESFKKWLDKMEMAFSPKARELKLPEPKGLLLVGVPGCGKSLSAKFVARKWKFPLLKLDAGRLYNKYMGESERNFRKAIELAESISPSILWIDEIEKSMTGGAGDMDSGVSKRILGTFLTWLQEKKAPVFVVATANDLFSLPAELLRKGRFDEVFFVDLPNESERAAIFKIHLSLRKVKIDDAPLAELLKLTDGFSGAEIEQVVVAGFLTCLQKNEPLSLNHLRDEITSTKPLSASRADYIAQLRAKGKEFRSVN